jgi:periplasmic protein TonB
MNKNDWYGISVSLALHALLLLMFAFVTGARADVEPIGYLQLEFGPIADGRPVQRAETTEPDVPDPDPQPEVKPLERAAPPEVARPVDLSRQRETRSERVIEAAPRTETVSPQRQNNPADVRRPDPQPEQRPVQPRGGGATDGSTGAADGREGTGNDLDRSSPFQIEGLNRTLVQQTLPAYAEKINAIIRVRITVDPTGRIVQRAPLTRGLSPALEAAVMEALANWRFNSLPANAPQEGQTGVVTFRFQLE